MLDITDYIGWTITGKELRPGGYTSVNLTRGEESLSVQMRNGFAMPMATDAGAIVRKVLVLAGYPSGKNMTDEELDDAIVYMRGVLQ